MRFDSVCGVMLFGVLGCVVCFVLFAVVWVCCCGVVMSCCYVYLVVFGCVVL